MGKSSKAPAAPDPVATASAQAQYNQDTARLQATLNRVNQYTPYGNLVYSKAGNAPDFETWFQEQDRGRKAGDFGQEWAGQSADWQQRNMAQFRSEMQREYQSRFPNADQWQAQFQYSPEVQRLYDAAMGSLSQPLDLSNPTVENRIAQLGQARLDPVWNTRQQSLETQLANQGIRAGSEAYTNAMRQFDTGRNDAYNNLALTARQQAIQELLQQRETPLNELNTLLGGGQMATSVAGNTPQVQVAPVDYTGAVNTNYQGQLQGYNAKMQQQNSNMSGLASLGSAAMMLFALSDKRAKTDIQKVGKLDNGLPVYSYRYKGSPLQQIGLMAQDVEKVRPEAVATRPDGLKAVNYGEAVA